MSSSRVGHLNWERLRKKKLTLAERQPVVPCLYLSEQFHDANVLMRCCKASKVSCASASTASTRPVSPSPFMRPRARRRSGSSSEVAHEQPMLAAGIVGARLWVRTAVDLSRQGAPHQD